MTRWWRHHHHPESQWCSAQHCPGETASWICKFQFVIYSLISDEMRSFLNRSAKFLWSVSDDVSNMITRWANGIYCNVTKGSHDQAHDACLCRYWKQHGSAVSLDIIWKFCNMEGFPSPAARKLSEESSGKDQEASKGTKEKPCRACTDFKSWMKFQKKQAPSVTTQVSKSHPNYPLRHAYYNVVIISDLMDMTD